MIIKNAYKPPVNLSKFSMLTTFIFGTCTVIMFTLNINLIFIVIFGTLGVFVLIFSIARDHKAQDITIKYYTERLKSPFKCPQCNMVLREPIPYKKFDGAPILYECQACQVLWHAGNYTEHNV